MAHLMISKPESRSDRVVVDVHNVTKQSCCENAGQKLVLDSDYPPYLTNHIGREEWAVLVTEMNEALETGKLPEMCTLGMLMCCQCLGLCICCGIPTCCLLGMQSSAYHRGVANADECLRRWDKKFKEADRAISIKTNGVLSTRTDGIVSIEEVMKHQLWIEIQISITSPPVQQGIPMGPMGPGYGASGGVPATPEQQQQMMLQLMAQQQALLAQMATTAKQQDAAKLPGEV